MMGVAIASLGLRVHPLLCYVFLTLLPAKLFDKHLQTFGFDFDLFFLSIELLLLLLLLQYALLQRSFLILQLLRECEYLRLVTTHPSHVWLLRDNMADTCS